MSTSAQYASTVQNAVANILTTSTNDFANGSSGNLVTIVTGAASGTRIDDITFTAMGSTTSAVQLILYVGDGTAANARAIMGISVGIVTVSGTQAAWTYKITGAGIVLKSGYKLYGCVSVSAGVNIAAVVTKAGDF